MYFGEELKIFKSVKIFIFIYLTPNLQVSFVVNYIIGLIHLTIIPINHNLSVYISCIST